MNQPTDPITLLLLTHNESSNISKNFTWLRKCTRIKEVIVVDDNSSDDTKTQIKKKDSPSQKVVFIQNNLNGDFAAQRNFGISKSSNDWILWLDADEIPSLKMISFLNKEKLHPGTNYSFDRHDIFLGYDLKHGENGTNKFIRLFNKNEGSFTGKVHEIWQGRDTATIDTGEIILHKTAVNLKQFLEKINFYSNIRAKELFEQKTPVNLFRIIFYPTGKFIQNYILRLGFLDGTPGIIMALSMSFYSFLVRAKLWHLYQQK